MGWWGVGGGPRTDKGAFVLSALLLKTHSILELRYLGQQGNWVGEQVEVSEMRWRAETTECGWVGWCRKAGMGLGQRFPPQCALSLPARTTGLPHRYGGGSPWTKVDKQQYRWIPKPMLGLVKCPFQPLQHLV